MREIESGDCAAAVAVEGKFTIKSKGWNGDDTQAI